MNRARRLEISRRIRSVPGHARNAAEAVMYLAHVARERHRLEQERVSLEKRIRNINSRLTAIAGAETKLVPLIQRRDAPPVLEPAIVASRLPMVGAAGMVEVTLQY